MHGNWESIQLLDPSPSWPSVDAKMERVEIIDGERALHLLFFWKVNQSGSVTDRAITIATAHAPNAQKGFRRSRFARTSLRSSHAEQRFTRDVILPYLCFWLGIERICWTSTRTTFVSMREGQLRTNEIMITSKEVHLAFYTSFESNSYKQIDPK